MNKHLLPVTCLFLFSFQAESQTLKSGMPEEMLRKKTAAIQYPVGVINNTYMVVENDYGTVFDFKNNIRSHVRRYAVNNLGNKGIVYLNPLVSDGAKEDNIIFNTILKWNKKIVGFYTLKGGNGTKTYPVFARSFDANLRPLKEKDKQIGELRHQYITGEFFDQGGLLVNGRDKLAVRNEFRYSISPDSTKMVLLNPGEKNDGANLKGKIYNSDLELIREFKVNIPLRIKAGEISGFIIDNNGNVFIHMKPYIPDGEKKQPKGSEKYYTDIHQIQTETNTVTSYSIQKDGQLLNFPHLVLDVSGNPVLVSMYRDLQKNSKQNVTHGIYAIKFKAGSLTPISEDIYTFTEEKDKKLANEISPFILNKITLRPDGGMYALGQLQYTIVVTRGSTGAMNSYYSVNGITAFCYIDASGKIRWSRYADTYDKTLETLTITGGVLQHYKDGKFIVARETDNNLKKKEKRMGIRFTGYDEDGNEIPMKFIDYHDELQDFSLVPGSSFLVAENTIMACMYKGFPKSRDHMQTAILQLKF